MPGSGRHEKVDAIDSAPIVAVKTALARRPMNSAGCDIDVAWQRLIDEAHRLLAALPLLAISLLLVWLGWALGGWLSRRAVFDRIASRNPSDADTDVEVEAPARVVRVLQRDAAEHQ
jgi:hypothetical protein